MKILGVDPGIKGGCAVVTVNDGAAPDIVDIINIPVVGVGAKERVDVLALRDWSQQHQPDHAVIERAQAMPKQGASSSFKYGRATDHRFRLRGSLVQHQPRPARRFRPHKLRLGRMLRLPRRLRQNLLRHIRRQLSRRPPRQRKQPQRRLRFSPARSP